MNRFTAASRAGAIVATAVALACAAGSGMACAASVEAYAAELGTLVNAYRARHGVGPLATDAALARLADGHAKRMAREQRLSHDGFEQRFAEARSRRCVENVGWNQPTPADELDAWIRSPTHRLNLLDPDVVRAGIASERGYVAFFACA